MSRYSILNQIRQLDPEKDHQQIVFLMGAYESPFLVQRALEFALFRTYAVPSISKLLDQTGEFANRGQRRYDDTSLIIAEITENGYDSERGRTAIKRMNRLHGRFDISNDDYLYVLSTFIFEPIRWNQQFGWRELDSKELQAGFIFWREVGRRMGIKDIPETYATFEQFNAEYERTHFRYTEENQRVGEATMQIFLGWYPVILRPLIRPCLHAFMDKSLLEAFGFPEAPHWAKLLAVGGMKLRARVMRWLPPRRKPRRFTQERNRTYPNGYQIEKLGPPEVGE